VAIAYLGIIVITLLLLWTASGPGPIGHTPTAWSNAARDWLGRIFGARSYVRPSTQELIRCLMDKNIDEGGRDDCAMALEDSEDPDAEAALATVALDPETPELLAETCGESLAFIWVRRGQLNESVVQQLQGDALEGARKIIQALRPGGLPGSKDTRPDPF
jgi:hypothetical protein